MILESGKSIDWDGDVPRMRDLESRDFCCRSANDYGLDIGGEVTWTAGFYQR